MPDHDDEDFDASSQPHKRNSTLSEKFLELLEESLVGIVGICFLVPIGILAYQAIGWLRNGFWEQIPISTIWLYFFGFLPTTEWVGLQTILNKIMNLELSVGLFLILLAVFLALFKLVENWREKSSWQ